MPRRLKIPTREKGRLEIYAIVEDSHGAWEADWNSLRSTPLGRLISRVPRSAFNHLLNGYSQPFVDALGLPPQGALSKLPSTRCHKQQGCSLYQKRICITTSSKLPWCYEPAGLNEVDSATRKVASDLVFLWKEEVYVVAVYDD